MNTPSTALVTGAEYDLGFRTTQLLAARGAFVIVHADTVEHGDELLERLVKEGADPLRLELVYADFAELEQVSVMARQVRDKHQQLSLLVNARTTPGSGQRVITADGNERTFQINYLAPYLLTRTLHEPLAATPGSRIINTGSVLHRGGTISWTDLNRTHRYTQLAVYAQSMLAVSMFTQLAARLWSDSCVAVCADPGTTDPALLRLYGPSVRPSTDAADVLARLSDPEFSPENGAFYERLEPAPATPPISGERALERLWKRSATLTGLD